MEDRSLRDRVIGPAESVRITMPPESQPCPRENEPLLVQYHDLPFAVDVSLDQTLRSAPLALALPPPGTTVRCRVASGINIRQPTRLAHLGNHIPHHTFHLVYVHVRFATDPESGRELLKFQP